MKAWEREYQFRKNLNPGDYQDANTDWGALDTILKSRKDHLLFLWESRVPGSHAPDSLFATAVQAWENKGYDVQAAAALLPGAKAACKAQNWGDLEMITGRMFRELFASPAEAGHLYHTFLQPSEWEEISRNFPEQAVPDIPAPEIPSDDIDSDFRQRIYHGWLAQICGGSYGTALEGYTGDKLRAYYGDRLETYTTEPETYNDDITFQLALLSAIDRLPTGKALASSDVADAWLSLIFFGWSAEYYALENLRRGIYPPESGSFRNPFSDWIGAQMRTMVCGLLAPGDPAEAARLAWIDSRVSHAGNGIYAGIHSAVLTSLAFTISDPRELLEASRRYLPVHTLFLHYFDLAMQAARSSSNHLQAWKKIEPEIRRYHWIHAVPNMAAVVFSLWFGNGDMTRSFRILGECGLDVDCNAGEVGTILGIMQNEVPAEWAEPIGDTLLTYVPGMEKMSIKQLAEWTADLGDKLRSLSS
jgi:ADP-ribosylglycohydrolase